MRTAAWVVVLVVSGVSVQAENWPQWRGPLGNGVSPESGVPVQWSPDSIAWKTRLAGTGVSSPVVWGDRVFVTSQRGRGARRPGSHPALARGDEAAPAEKPLPDSAEGEVVFVVEAFHRADGRRLWEYRLPAAGTLAEVHEKHNLATPSPVTDGQTVVAWFGTGQLVALTGDGKLVWQRHLGQGSPFQVSWGHGSSPALYRDLVILVCYHEPASYLLALDKTTGETRWKVDRGKGVLSYTTPVVIPGPSGDEMVVNSTDRIDAYDPSTGTPLWHTGASHRFAIPVPAHHEGVLYASRGYRSGPFMAIRTGGRGDVSATHVKWSVPTGAPYVSSLLHYQGLLYMGSDAGVASAIDAASGEKVWQERTGGIFSASPVAADGNVYFASETGETTVFRAGREPRILARNRIEGRIVASPAISEGQIFIRTDEHLMAIGKRPTR